MRWFRWVLAIAISVPGCGATHVGDIDADVLDGSSDHDDAASAEDADPTYADSPFHDASTAPLTATCGGTACAAGEICCLVDLRCIAPGDPSCTVPAGTPPGACASNADCAPTESCQVVDERGGPLPAHCGGLGRCWTATGTCGGMGPGVCGCDGHTYADACEAASARVRLIGYAPCGSALYAQNQSCNARPCEHGTCDPMFGICAPDDLLYACGLDSQCPSGQDCCELTGLCLGASDASLCRRAEPGEITPCNTDRDCGRYEGWWWTGSENTFCDGDTCGGAGGCVFPPGSCAGTLDPVCGCDGQSYQNPCEAHRSRTRVAHAGAC